MCGDFVEIIGRYCGKREENGFSVAFLYSLVPNIVIKYYLCGCEWLYGICFGRFGALWLTVRLLQWGKSFHLDELPEFNRSVLEVMRQPLEDRIVSILRVKCLAGFFDGDFSLVRLFVA